MRRNLRDYSKKYEEEDLRTKRSLQGDMLKQRKEKHEVPSAMPRAAQCITSSTHRTLQVAIAHLVVRTNPAIILPGKKARQGRMHCPTCARFELKVRCYLEAVHVRLVQAFEAFLRETSALYAEQRAGRVGLRGGVESDNESAYTLIEDVDEVELSYKEETIDV